MFREPKTSSHQKVCADSVASSHEKAWLSGKHLAA